MSEAQTDRRRVVQTTALRVLGDGLWRPTRQVATEGGVSPRTTLAALQGLEREGRVERRLVSLGGVLRRMWHAADLDVRALGLACGVCKRPGPDVCDECWVNGGGLERGGADAALLADGCALGSAP